LREKKDRGQKGLKAGRSGSLEQGVGWVERSKEDERPTSNIQRPTSNEKTNVQYRTLLNSDSSKKFLFPGNPKSAIQGMLGSWEAGKLRGWRRMGRAEPGVMGFALPSTFSCLPGYSKLRMKAIPIG